MSVICGTQRSVDQAQGKPGEVPGEENFLGIWGTGKDIVMQREV
jgi:hypothetical protein